MARPLIEPISSSTLPEFAEFLHQNLQRDRSPSEWITGLSTTWLPDQPNHGFVVRDEGRIVGGIGAYYALRTVKGVEYRLCNITSWCVLDNYRQQSMRLAMTLVGQPGFHYTDFSPTAVVGATLKFLKFKPLDDRQIVSLNLPSIAFDDLKVIFRPEEIRQYLDREDLKIYEDHCIFPWLKHVLVGRPGQWCHIVFKERRFKGTHAAAILYASNPKMLRMGWRRLSSHLLWQGFLSTHVEYRVLNSRPWLSVVRSGFNAKVFLSDTLKDEDIDYLYSESVALDL